MARAVRGWALVPALGAAALVMVLLIQGLMPDGAPGPRLVQRLVETHIAYAEIAQPAEFASSSRRDVAAWFRERVGLDIPVPGYSAAGIHLLGGRITGAEERTAVYLLYEKGHVLMSVFMASGSGRSARSTAAR
jgi:anti-sigma factor RsiW